MFNAILISKADDQTSRADLTQLNTADLPEGEVSVRVEWSTLNYKDALAITGKGPIVRRFPMVPGVDLAGVVEHSASDQWQPGDRVLLNGWGVGEGHWGGLAQRARVKAGWLTRLPDNLSSRQAMAIGTAGYTAMLCLMALERHGLTPDKGEVLVTGASGGVGSLAIMLLAQRGYQVIASTGRMEEQDYLTALGAAEVMHRDALSAPGKPLAKARWAAVIDSVGSHTLANACAQTMEDGLVAACGLAQGMDFPATVAPFILRGVTLLGINSVTRPQSERDQAWARLAEELDTGLLEQTTREIALGEAIDAADDLLAGRVRGRLVVDVNR
ncbi:MDR family oxidoreductase [Oceanimonas baumannii]|uniref:Acrylyl-CoA reductase (NADPH) n=1 Tax=Oceanimonas baumannii TaxID=129578 RepID=A0A235CGG1_9GAMM|nr:MDR family oxidoreductase [Oceanimonas baumannii]OYD23652.1 alcohol dehydrogenase [Oceanimonas baumannii]TDW55846.1 acrylyl-CoA reductase (NADPH) [Oceanimonas baumannii]